MAQANVLDYLALARGLHWGPTNAVSHSGENVTVLSLTVLFSASVRCIVTVCLQKLPDLHHKALCLVTQLCILLSCFHYFT